MFKKRDYLSYFKQLYEIELIMKREAEELYRMIENAEALKIIQRIIHDEVNHANIVKKMIKLL